MSEEANAFNLVDEQWIPVLMNNGDFTRVGIRDALLLAQEIRQIAASNPMDRVAILRFLLAVLYWCKGNPPDDAAGHFAGGFPAEWLAKLDEHRECFELLGNGERFMQDQSLRGVLNPATCLMHDLPTGTNIAHFRHTRDGIDGLCLACCALGLLRWSVAAPSGTAGSGQSMTATLSGMTPAYSIPIGSSLHETLIRSWCVAPVVHDDRAVWEGATGSSPLGVLKGLTWRARRVLLAPHDGDDRQCITQGTCCYCARPTEQLVKYIRFRPGWQRPSMAHWLDDPHLLTTTNRQGKVIIPSWPSPADCTEDHSGAWHTAIGSLLRRAHPLSERRCQYFTSMLASSKALYKHASGQVLELARLGDDHTFLVLQELEWLRQQKWHTVSARVRTWDKRPVKHVLVDALCSRTAKGHHVRACACALSPALERTLERAFMDLIDDVAETEPDDVVGQQQALLKWRDTVRTAFLLQGEEVVNSLPHSTRLRHAMATSRVRHALDTLSKGAKE